jgi:hypothetical protein
MTGEAQMKQTSVSSSASSSLAGAFPRESPCIFVAPSVGRSPMMPSLGNKGGGGKLGVVFGRLADARFELPPLPLPRPLPPLRPPRSSSSWLLFDLGVRCGPFPRPLPPPPRALVGVAGAALLTSEAIGGA